MIVLLQFVKLMKFLFVFYLWLNEILWTGYTSLCNKLQEQGNLQSKKEISYGRKKLSVKRAEEQADKLYRKQSDKQGNSFKQQDEE